MLASVACCLPAGAHCKVGVATQACGCCATSPCSQRYSMHLRVAAQALLAQNWLAPAADAGGASARPPPAFNPADPQYNVSSCVCWGCR
jgi:hypothetical protein